MTIFLCIIAGVLLTALALMVCACAMYIVAMLYKAAVAELSR